MSDLVLLILIFLAAGLVVLASNLLLGRLVRPDRPSPEKGQVYECGEEPIGDAWVQFDLRFYVVALLFIVFDVELAFFFPWAVVFGSATRAGDETRPVAVRREAAEAIQFPGSSRAEHSPAAQREAPAKLESAPTASAAQAEPPAPDSRAMHSLAWLAFEDILVFFFVLLVGFAYLWRRGDLQWVRSLESQSHQEPATPGV
jgi:NADH-quinone oxidoreductase subunit A